MVFQLTFSFFNMGLPVTKKKGLVEGNTKANVQLIKFLGLS